MNKIILGLILISAAAMRLITLPHLQVFTPDEEYLLYIAQTLVKDFHIIWIGVSALGFDLYMGPLWIYIIYPFVAIFKGNPLTIGAITSVLGIFTTLLTYLLGKKIFSEKVGIIAAFLYATSALIVYYDQQPYPPAVPFLSLLITLSLYMSKYSSKWWLIFALSYGMVFHIHLSLVPVLFVALYWGFLQRKSLSKKIILSSILVFILTVSPLIAFDYFHKASNITTPIRILKSTKNYTVKPNLNQRFNNLLQAFGRVFYLEPYKNNADEILYPCIIDTLSTTTKVNWLFSAIILSLFGFLTLRKGVWEDYGRKLLLLLSLTFLIPFTLLPIINPIEYYLLGFFPLLLLITSSIVDLLNKPAKYLFYIITVFFILHGIFTVFTAKGDYGLDTKKRLIIKVMKVVSDNPYELKEEGSCHKYGGWRYLFSVYGKKPERSSEDSNFAWLYPNEVSTKVTKYSVIMNEARTSIKLPGYKFVLNEGGFSAYIFEH